jgi:2-keto-3-deoxy-6-phosphogluconate aldolase
MLSDKHMPKGPKGQKRPADVISNAVHVMRIATGEVAEALTDDGKNAAAVALGRRGGLARAKTISKAERKKIAIKGAHARWSGRRKKN